MNESEKKNRIVFSLMALPVKMAAEFKLSSKDTRHWLETAYFHFLRVDEKTLKQISHLLDIGSRKTSQLSEKLRTNFLAAEQDFGLPRRIEYLIWGAPISRKRIHQLLSNEYEPEEIDIAIEALLSQERVNINPSESVELFSLAKSESRLYDDGFMARIDGLNHLVNTFSEVVLQRFVKENKNAFARTLTFHVPKEEGQELLEQAYEELYQNLAAIEEKVGSGPSEAVDFSVLWARRSSKEKKST